MSDVYNSSYTGTQIDSAVGSVLNKESTWDGKQNKLTGQQGQVVGFDSTGNAVAQDNPGGGLPTGGTPGQMLYQGESGAEWGDKPIFRVAVTIAELSDSIQSVTCDKTPLEIVEAYNKGFEIQPELRISSSPIPFYSGQVFAIEYYVEGSAVRVMLAFPLEINRRYMFFGEQIAVETPSWEVDSQSVSARGIKFSSTSGLTATNVRDAIEEVNTKATRTAIPISIPTTGWADNKQTFAVTGIPSDPTTYEVHLSQVGATNVSAAIACGLYIADEAENSLTLAVSSVPEAAFQVYAVVQGVSV